MKKIYFVRHGETDANLARIVSGGEHEAQVTENGREQAKRAGQDLKDKKIELVVASPMERTKETANIICKEIDYSPEKILHNELLKERSAGPYSGKHRDEYLAHLKSGNLDKGIEGDEELWQRCRQACDWLKTLDTQKILVVSHGGFGRMMRAYASGMPHSHFHQVDRLANCEVFEFELE